MIGGVRMNDSVDSRLSELRDFLNKRSRDDDWVNDVLKERFISTHAPLVRSDGGYSPWKAGTK